MSAARLSPVDPVSASGGPDLLVVRHGIPERDDEDRPVLTVRQSRRDRAREELADGFAEPVLAGPDDEQTGVDCVGEVLDREGGIADELPNAPVDAVAVEDRSGLGLHPGEFAFADGDVHIDGRRMHVSVRVFIRHEPGHIDMDDPIAFELAFQGMKLEKWLIQAFLLEFASASSVGHC